MFTPTLRSALRSASALALAAGTGGAVAQVLGLTILLYRAHPERPTITLP